MATKKKAKSKKAHRTWSAGNLGKQRFSDEMKQQLIKAVSIADKNGTLRSRVYEALAAEWTASEGQEFTPNQVNSKFHQCKKSFGYDVVRQKQPGKAKPKAKAKAKPKASSTTKPKAKRRVKVPIPKAKTPAVRPEVILANLTVDLPRAVAALQAEIDAAKAERKKESARADAAEKALARISKVLGTAA